MKCQRRDLNAKGVAAVNLLQLQPEEKITAIICHEKECSDDWLSIYDYQVRGLSKRRP
jgi:hypothetical protein